MNADNYQRNITAIDANLKSLKDSVYEIKAILSELVRPTEPGYERMLEIRELARQIGMGNRQAIKDWNRRENLKNKKRV